MMDILLISQNTENRNLSMNLKLVTTYLKFYTKTSVHFISRLNVKEAPLFLLASRDKLLLPNKV